MRGREKKDIYHQWHLDFTQTDIDEINCGNRDEHTRTRQRPVCGNSELLTLNVAYLLGVDVRSEQMLRAITTRSSPKRPLVQ